MPNDPTFDLTKRYMHVEDNEDGTMTLTVNGFGAPTGYGPVMIVVEGELDTFLHEVSSSVSNEDVEDFRNKSVVIPNEVEEGEVL